MKCPITNENIPQGEEIQGHVKPKSQGGRRWVWTWGKIDNKVGYLFDAELEKYISRLKSGEVDCNVAISGIDCNSFPGTINCHDGKMQIKINATGYRRDRLWEAVFPVSNFSGISGSATIKCLDYRKIILSTVHSTLLHMTRANPNKCGNRLLFQNILKKGLKNINSVTDKEWIEIGKRCCIAPAYYVRKDRKMIKSNKRDVVAFNYGEVAYGICCLNATFQKYPDGEIKNIFIADC